MTPTAIVTDSAADMPPERAAALGIRVVPLVVTFGEEEFQSGIDISSEQFWHRLTTPGAPFPRTAAASPGTFQRTFEAAFAAGCETVVYVGVGARLSATLQSGRIARDALRNREIHIVDSESASMATGLLAEVGAEMAIAGATGAEIVGALERRKGDVRLYVVLETLEYLKRGGRISAAQAALGTVLSVKPIITLRDGVVETADRVRTRSKARARLIELLTARPAERVAVLHAMTPDIEAFADELLRAADAADPRALSVQPIGPSVGPHVGPGAYGAAVLQAS